MFSLVIINPKYVIGTKDHTSVRKHDKTNQGLSQPLIFFIHICTNVRTLPGSSPFKEKESEENA
jgi:hypothetical protein